MKHLIVAAFMLSSVCYADTPVSGKSLLNDPDIGTELKSIITALGAEPVYSSKTWKNLSQNHKEPLQLVATNKGRSLEREFVSIQHPRTIVRYKNSYLAETPGNNELQILAFNETGRGDGMAADFLLVKDYAAGKKPYYVKPTQGLCNTCHSSKPLFQLIPWLDFPFATDWIDAFKIRNRFWTKDRQRYDELFANKPPMPPDMITDLANFEDVQASYFDRRLRVISEKSYSAVNKMSVLCRNSMKCRLWAFIHQVGTAAKLTNALSPFLNFADLRAKATEGSSFYKMHIGIMEIEVSVTLSQNLEFFHDGFNQVADGDLSSVKSERVDPSDTYKMMTPILNDFLDESNDPISKNRDAISWNKRFLEENKYSQSTVNCYGCGLHKASYHYQKAFLSAGQSLETYKDIIGSNASEVTERNFDNDPAAVRNQLTTALSSIVLPNLVEILQSQALFDLLSKKWILSSSDLINFAKVWKQQGTKKAKVSMLSNEAQEILFDLQQQQVQKFKPDTDGVELENPEAIFARNCLTCHSQGSGLAEFSLENPEAIRNFVGRSGPHRTAFNLVAKNIMPPTSSVVRLTESEREILLKWFKK